MSLPFSAAARQMHCFVVLMHVTLSNSGKSSLLNSLLEEAAVLPTSGSRGCTAAVVELVYNDLSNEEDTATPENTADAGRSTVPVYRGEVEFITLEDWQKE